MWSNVSRSRPSLNLKLKVKNKKKRHSMTCCRSCSLFILAFTQKYFAYGYVAGGLIWNRNLDNFIPIANISSFAAKEQALWRGSRELETHKFRRTPVRFAYYQEKNIFTFYDNNTKITGVCGELWNILADYLNFTLVVSRVNASHYGRKMPNGSYDGLMGMLLRNEIDIIPRTGYYVSESKVMAYTTPIWNNRYRTYIRPEFKVDSTWMFNMFDSQVWCSILCLFLLMSAFGYTAQRISIKVSNDNKSPHNLHDHLFYTFATLCCQGFIPDSLYQRVKILALTKKFMAWLVLIVLSSHLISYMTNRRPLLPFEDLGTMFNSSTYNIVIFKGSMIFDKFERNVMNTTTEAVIKERVRSVDTPERLYEKGCWGKRNYAIMESEDRQRAYGRFVCKLVPVGIPYFATWVAAGVAKTFKYKRSIDIGILKLNEFGLTDGMRDRYMESATVTYDANPFTSVNFDQVLMLFMILCMGMITSITIFVFENAIFIYKCNRCSPRQ